jgi:hypothetical protein
LHLWKVIFTGGWTEEPSAQLFKEQKAFDLGFGKGKGGMETPEETAPSRFKQWEPAVTCGKKYSGRIHCSCGQYRFC